MLVFIQASIVDNEISLLLSRASIKREKLVLDFSRDMAEVFDESMKLMCTSTCNYCIPLTHILLTNNDTKISFVLHTSALKSLSFIEKKELPSYIDNLPMHQKRNLVNLSRRVKILMIRNF